MSHLTEASGKSVIQINDMIIAMQMRIIENHQKEIADLERLRRKQTTATEEELRFKDRMLACLSKLGGVGSSNNTKGVFI